MIETPPKAASWVGVLGAFLIVGFLVFVMQQYLPEAPVNKARIEERKKALAELRADNERALNNEEILDKGKGLIRLRMDRAMELTVEEYKNPAAARSSLIARAEKASAPPPKPPEVPSKFE